MANLRELIWEVRAEGLAGLAKGVEGANGMLDKLKQKFSDIDVDLKGLSSKLKKEGKALQQTGKKLTKSLTLPAVAIGGASLKVVKDFDDGMSKVQALTGATTQEFEKMRQQAIKLGSETPHSASDAAEGMQILAAAGKNVGEIEDIVPNMLTLMSAGSVDANVAAKALTGTMAQFNMESSESGRIMDVFARGSADSSTNVGELQEAFKMAGGALANMNMDVEQSTAMTGVLANVNIVGSQAGTTLSAMAREITANADKFKDLGVSVYDANGNIRDMGSVMTDLEGSLAGMTNEQRDAALATVFSGQSQKGVNAFLSQGSDKYKELEKSMYGAKGAANEMADTMEDNIGGALRSMKSSLEGASIAIGDAMKGDIAKAATFIGNLATKFRELSPETQQMIVRFGGLVAAIGPTISIFGKAKEATGNAIDMFSKIPDGIEKIKSGFSKIPAAIGFLTSPVGLAIMAIGALVAIGIVLYKNWDTIKAKASEIGSAIAEKWNALKGATAAAWNGMLSIIGGVLDGIKNKWQSVKNFLAHPIKGTIEIAQKGAAAVSDKIKGGKKPKVDGSHAGGLNSVPFDNYLGNLHAGEMVLPAQTANKYRALGGDIHNIPTNTTSNTSSTNFAPVINVTVAGSADGHNIASAVRDEMENMFRNLNLQRA